MRGHHRRLHRVALVRTAKPRALRRRHVHELCRQLHRGRRAVRRRRIVRGWQLREHRRRVHGGAGLPHLRAYTLRGRQLRDGQLGLRDALPVRARDGAMRRRPVRAAPPLPSDRRLHPHTTTVVCRRPLLRGRWSPQTL